LTKPVINIGRDASNDIVIPESIISSFHVQIVRDGDQLVLLHPNPSRPHTVNGLMYQGQIIAGDQPFRRPLKRGDVFRIGDEHGTLVTLTFNDGTGAPQEVLPEIRPIPLRDAVITIGRLPDNQVVLNHPQVSAHHARLERDGQSYRIVDLASTNHVYVNTQQVKNQTLQAGDVIRIGPFKLTFTGTQLTQQDESSGIRIDAVHMQKSGSKKVVLINDISLVIPPHNFVAIVGGSGAGKSTLMDALNGQRPVQKGLILYNGQDYYRHLAAFSTQLGYVPQDDIIHRDLSVERALYYAARLRLPDDFTRAQIKQRIDEVLEDVEMKNRRKLLVSKLSGGQRKRVSIALELLANPSIFFLDEPTSGLDPGLDRKMMVLLRRLADKGHTIVLVTHATSNINVCDYICFLAQGGRMAYYGPPNEARTFFGKSSFAEIYTALEPTDEHPNVPAEAEARFKASPDYQRYVMEPLKQGPSQHSNAGQETAAIQAPRRGNFFKQFFLLSLRYMELLKNDAGNLLILLAQAPVIAIILLFMAAPNTFAPDQVVSCPTRENIQATSGPIVSTNCQRVADFLKTPEGQLVAANQQKSPDQLLQDIIAPSSGINAQEILFIMAFAAVMFGCINAAREIVKEGPIYRRERAVNLGIGPYMLSKCVVLGLLCLIQSGILVLIVNAGIPFHQGIFLPVLLEVYITLALTSLAGLMLGLAISAIAPNTDRAMSFVPIVLIPQVIFSGIIFTLNGTAAQVFGGIFAARWAIAGLGSSIGLHADKLGVDDFAYCGTLFSTCSKAQAINHLLIVWSALLAMIIVFGLVVGYFMKLKDRRK
jgi:ABC-type multidrug transport system ATPase subunit/pSer/pThr/pTyr-binding forkhead associated (FHA) protein